MGSTHGGEIHDCGRDPRLWAWISPTTRYLNANPMARGRPMRHPLDATAVRCVLDAVPATISSIVAASAHPIALHAVEPPAQNRHKAVEEQGALR